MTVQDGLHAEMTTGLVPCVSGTDIGVEVQNHTMATGLDPGVAGGNYSDLAGWNFYVEPVPASLVGVLNVIVDGMDAGYFGS